MKRKINIKKLNAAIKLSGQSQSGFIAAVTRKFSVNPRKLKDYVNRTA
jgi:hypothetical protein